MFKLTYRDVGGRIHVKRGETMEDLVRLASRMARLELIEEHKIELSEETEDLKRDTDVFWAIPSGEVAW